VTKFEVKVKDWINTFEDFESLNSVITKLSTDKSVVYTYGVWDLLHPGHIRLLARAKNLGDFLVVGVVSDSPVAELKGEDRPVQNQNERLINVGSLRFVDAAIPQKEYDPSSELRNLFRVNILTKGDDWEYIPGVETVEELGGRLIKLGYSESFSTSKIVKKINTNNE